MSFGRESVLVLIVAVSSSGLPVVLRAQLPVLDAAQVSTPKVPVNPLALSIGADLLSPGKAPKVWTVDAGKYRGMQVEIRPRAAGSLSRGGEHFWRFSNSSGAPQRVVGWSSERFPIPLAFRAGMRGSLDATDSIRFWRIVSDLESDLGTPLFRPMTLAPNEDPTDVVIVSLEPQREAGTQATTLITWDQLGNIYDGRILFRDLASATDQHVVSHELMHVIGFGHTSAWPSIMRASVAAEASSLTVEDVAYAQVALRARGVQERLIADDLEMTVAIREFSRSCRDPADSILAAGHYGAGVTLESNGGYIADPERPASRHCW